MRSLLFLACAATASAQLQPADRIAITGDSITEQKLYSVMIEEYLLATQPVAQTRSMQFGWGGETSWGFYGRMHNDVLPFKPSVVTTCYGMNDGGYDKITPEIENHYRETLTKIVDDLKSAGTRFIILGSPGVVDTSKYPNGWMKMIKPNTSSKVYNKTLGQLREIARDVAKKENVSFADVYGAMMPAMQKAKAKFGKDYAFAGGDGVHPGPNGHLAMAYAFLKAMGCDGNVGEIKVDFAAKSASTSEGHKVISASADGIEIESTKYPMCFPADPKDKDHQAARDVLDCVPFNQDLNRLTLQVTNLGADKAKITWGNASKEFTAEQLAAGINLSAEFVDNPFVQSFEDLDKQVRDRQNYETPFIKEFITKIPQFKTMAPGQDESFANVTNAAWTDTNKRIDASTAPLKPVRHTIKIEPIK